MKKRDEKKVQIAIGLFLAVLFISLVLYTKKSFFYWDEIVYIGMSKYIFFAGEAGLFEMIRPPIVSLLLIPVAWLPQSPIFLYRFISLLVTAGMLACVYTFTKIHSTKRGALLAIFALALTGIFIKYSFRISAGIFALLFMFISLLLIERKKYVWAGFFASLTFLTRFPMGAYALSLGIAFTLQLIYDVYKSKKIKQKKLALKKYIKNALSLFVGFVGPTLIYLAYNVATNPGKPLLRAAFDPFFYASAAITGGYLWLYEQGFFFYAIELVKQMPLLALVPLAIVALIYIQIKKKKFLLAENIITIFTIIAFIYFSQLAHKELRYAIVFLPAMFVLIPFAIHHISDLFRKGKYKSHIFNVILILLVLFSYVAIFEYNPLGLYQEEEFPAEKMYSFECFGFLEQHTNEPTVATSPYPAAFITNRIHPSYFTLENVAKLYKDYNFLILTPTSFPCEQTDKSCRITNDAIIYEMIKESDVLFYDPEPSRECIILTKKEIDTVSKEEKQKLKDTVLERFAYQDQVEFSITPFAKRSSVMLVLNDIVPMDNENIWKQNQFSALITVMKQKGVPFSLAVIPKSLERLDNDRLFVLQRLLDNQNIDVLQKGYDYTAKEEYDSFAGLPLGEQRNRIKEGKENIYKYLFREVDSFFVPYSKSDQNTINALIGNEFTNIATSSHDSVHTGELHRFNVGVETVLDWENLKMLEVEELAKQTELQNLVPYILINFYYYTIGEQDLIKVDGYIDWLDENYYLTTIDEYRGWEEQINNMPYKLTDSEFIIKNITQYKDLPLGLNIRSATTLVTNVDKLYVRNIGFGSAHVCINTVCATLQKEEIKLFDNFPTEE